MRVALVHDWLAGMRGGEKVLERLCGLFPGASIHTLLWNRGSVSPAIETHPISTSFVQRLPGAARYYRWYLPLFPAAIEGLRLPEVDAVISSSHCAAKGIRVPRGAFHLSYVHTPMRYVWDLEEEYFPPGKFPWPLSSYVRHTCARLRAWDVASSRGPHALIANSAHVAGRIRRCWGREADVVHPPVAVDRFAPAVEREDFYLVAGAFAPYKRADLAIEACRRLGRRLIVAGAGQDEARLRRAAGPGIEFRGWLGDAGMAGLYATARALLFPGEEDFGIVPVEALASGCPVIAFGRGGALETVGAGAPAEALEAVRAGRAAVVPGGVLFGRQSADGLAAAIMLAEGQIFDAAALSALARPFDEREFDPRFTAVFEERYRAWRDRREDQPATASA